jgi:hypothetical protein
MHRVLQTFVAYTPEGDPQTLCVVQDLIDASSHSNPDAEVGGIKRIRTRQGFIVKKLRKCEYEIVGSGQKLITLAKDAP